ncbi:MAG: hypothetical protein Q4C75_02625, partial [Bergeyella zoohelcum]|nr:hypothetical protein [Bergeyella zoohelcum]
AREVCKRLMPSKVYKLNTTESKLDDSSIQEIENNNYIIVVKAKKILVVAGSPTEQEWKITDIIDLCKNMQLDITLALVCMRSFERKDGFSTEEELVELSELLLLEEKITRIDDDNFQESQEWNDRVNKIVELINENI